MTKYLLKHILPVCLALILLSLLLSGCEKKRVTGGTLTVAVNQTRLNWQGLGFWTTDKDSTCVSELSAGMSPVYFNLSGKYEPDTAVVQGVVSAENPDGSKCFTVTLQPDLTFSDGTPLTARHYVETILVLASAEAAELGATTFPWSCYEGYGDYLSGGTFSGVRLVDSLTFTVTVAASFVPYSEELTYLDFCPIDTALWMPENTVSETGDEGSVLIFPDSAVSLSDTISEALSVTVQQRGTGPYTVAAITDTGITLLRNSHFCTSENDSMPMIDEIQFVISADPVSAVLSGEADLCTDVTASTTVLNTVSAAGNVATALKGAEYFTDLIFSCDTAPTDSVAVRQAVACLCSIENYTKAIGGTGASTPDFITPDGMWYEDSQSSKRKNDIATATALLNADGWTLDENGSLRTVGLRYKLVDTAQPGDKILDNGWILRPLRLTAVLAEGSPAADLLGTMRTEAQRLGMEINIDVCSTEELEARLYRNSAVSLSYASSTANLYITEMPIVSVTDFPDRFTTDIRLLYTGVNPTYLQDEELYRMALKLAYTTLDENDYIQLFTEFKARWSDLTPEVPLARSVTRDIYNTRLQGYTPGDTCSTAKAIMRAWISSD